MKMKLETAVQRVFDRANLIGVSVDLDGLMLQYKVIRDLYYDDPEQYDAIYDDLTTGLFGRGYQR